MIRLTSNPLSGNGLTNDSALSLADNDPFTLSDSQGGSELIQKFQAIYSRYAGAGYASFVGNFPRFNSALTSSQTPNYQSPFVFALLFPS
ncbi:hypothetical protein J6590_079792, partial [Homalodisca vitripennis]